MLYQGLSKQRNVPELSDCRLKGGFFFPESDNHFIGEHEIDHLDEALNHVKNFRVALDCGAHVGTWTRKLSDCFNTVIAFEPDPGNFRCLVKNNPKGNVMFYQSAVGDKPMKAGLHIPIDPGNSGAAWVVEGQDFDVIKIDDLELLDVDFIKLDIEGYEPFAIHGARNTIERFSPVILAEQKPITARYGLHYMEAGRLLHEIGYSLKSQMNNDFIYGK